MAIYIDGIQLQPKKDGTSIEKRYFEERAEIKKLFEKFKKPDGSPASLIFQRDFVKKFNRNGTSHRPAPPLAIPLVSPYYDESVGALEVRYSTSPPRKSSGRLYWTKGVELIDEIYSVSESQMDLAWFLLKASTFFQNGVLKLVDLGVEIEAKWDSMVLQSEVVKFLFSPELEEDRLAEVYAAFQGAKYTYDTKDSVKGNAMKLWTVAMAEVQKGEQGAMKELANAIKATAPKEEQGGVVSTVEVDGIEYPVVEMPAGWNKASILKEAANYKIELPKRVMSNNVLYSILQAKITPKE